jgi:xanthine dehydrogenase YagT iron-sulfur-binding subunit
MKEPTDAPQKSRVSRRGLLQGIGMGAGAAGLMEAEAHAQSGAAPVMGPGAVDITLNINGKPMKASVEPRETLLDVMRNHLDLTGAKRVCDRGTCGACTVMVNGKVAYACSMLAVDAVGKQIQTIEAVATSDPVVKAFVNHDAQQCGYCTPGFVMAVKGMLNRVPNPTPEAMKEHLGGNLCRCGTYMGIKQAVLEAAKGGRNG